MLPYPASSCYQQLQISSPLGVLLHALQLMHDTVLTERDSLNAFLFTSCCVRIVCRSMQQCSLQSRATLPLYRYQGRPCRAALCPNCTGETHRGHSSSSSSNGKGSRPLAAQAAEACSEAEGFSDFYTAGVGDSHLQLCSGNSSDSSRNGSSWKSLLLAPHTPVSKV